VAGADEAAGAGRVVARAGGAVAPRARGRVSFLVAFLVAFRTAAFTAAVPLALRTRALTAAFRAALRTAFFTVFRRVDGRRAPFRVPRPGGPLADFAAREGRCGGALRLAMMFPPLLDLMTVIRLA